MLRLRCHSQSNQAGLIKEITMSENNALTVPTKKRTNTFAQAAVAFAVVSVTNAALAADSITALGEGASENISAALAIALGIFAIGVGIKGAFKGYEYLKSGIAKA